MNRKPIDSHMIKSAGYSVEEQILEVEFLKGNIGRYSGVPPEVWAAFQRAPSKGRFLIETLKPNYHYTRV